jgi:bacteriorhodopsin
MLLFGYMGEIKMISIVLSTILGFIPFSILFYLIFLKMKKKNKSLENPVAIKRERLFYIFVILWTMYGINQLVVNLEFKNLTYNVLDLFTKGFFGLYVFGETWEKLLVT